MQFLKRKSEHLEQGSERLAARIAARIVSWQLSLATKINCRMNKYTKAAQRKFLWVFCAAWTAVTCFNFFHVQQAITIHAVHPNLVPAHIGQASDKLQPGIKPMPRTDSLTIKK